MTTEAGPRGGSPKMVLVAAAIGTTVEWYDFMVFGTAAALVFKHIFFPGVGPLAGTLFSFATFGAGFIARPIGGLLFGHFGDRVGRKSMLALTLGLMGVATAGMGLLPTYQTVGAAAPILLVVLRLVQGLGLGGEWGGSALMTVEHAPPHRRGLYGSFTQIGGGLGQLLATGSVALVVLMPDNILLTWGWRIPFLLSALLVLVGLVIRLKLAESPVFAEHKSAEEKRAERPVRVPVIEVLRTAPGNVARAALAAFGNNALIYVVTVFTLTYGVEALHIPEWILLTGVVIGSFVDGFAIPSWGALSDRVGRRPVMVGGAVLLVVWAYPFFWLLETRSAPAVWVAFTVAIAGARAAMYAPQPAYFSELFRTGVRYSGASLGTNLSTVCVGGTAPFIAAALSGAAGGAWWPVSAYLIVLGLLSLITIATGPETRGTAIAAGEKNWIAKGAEA